MNIWKILGIEATNSVEEIRKAYSEKIKTVHVEDDPEGFIQLRDAYKSAVKMATQKLAPVKAPYAKTEKQLQQEDASDTRENSSFDFSDLSDESTNERFPLSFSRAEDKTESNLFDFSDLPDEEGSEQFPSGFEQPEEPPIDEPENEILNLTTAELWSKAAVELNSAYEHALSRDDCAMEPGESIAYSVIIPRNFSLPANHEQRYATMSDHQESIYFKLYQGESFLASQNRFLDQFEIGVPPLPIGEATVLVSFSYSAKGTLVIEFKCEQSDTVCSKRIIKNKKLSEEEIEACLKNSEESIMYAREQSENIAVLMRGRRLLREFSGDIRDDIESRLTYFESMLETAAGYTDVSVIRKQISIHFDHLISRLHMY